ncbi:hypothetical protein L2Y94_05640 [Luteibacter aegosomatis]|uniref:hypothetical protein n=1 Tax=Luteibacter aegosomatis TaxID=2911537 RepID=UPI001FF7980C|nr:hypothetical protein [Luteibacter aegosomatis]UPG86837.1 hypothetical protein L2Y94_05640 [Luteibacter aegosomatis]
MQAAELLARLNPTTVRYDIGRGGIPELTAQDIAAAVAMVPAGIGRDLMCLLHWPDQVAVTRRSIDRALMDVQFKEWTRRELAMYRALMAVACDEDVMGRSTLTRQYSDANAQRWPKLHASIESPDIAEPWALLRAAVLEEIRYPKGCGECQGTGNIRRRDGECSCTRCLGSGKVRYGTTWRAARLKMKESSFNQRWIGPYEWLYDFMAQELQRAEHEFVKAVRR